MLRTSFARKTSQWVVGTGRMGRRTSVGTKTATPMATKGSSHFEVLASTSGWDYNGTWRMEQPELEFGDTEDGKRYRTAGTWLDKDKRSNRQRQQTNKQTKDTNKHTHTHMDTHIGKQTAIRTTRMPMRNHFADLIAVNRRRAASFSLATRLKKDIGK